MEPTRLSRRSFLALTTMAAAGMTLKPAFGESQDLAYLTLKEASELIRRKTVPRWAIPGESNMRRAL
jgi:hypothetical protein